MTVSCISAFDNKAILPDDSMVAAALGAAFPVWEELRTHTRDNFPDINGEWKHYGKAAGWTYKLLSKKRNLLFFIPLTGAFRLRIVLGEKAAARAEALPELPLEIKAAICAATAYAEGRSIDIDIDRREQLDAVQCLLKIKYES